MTNSKRPNPQATAQQTKSDAIKSSGTTFGNQLGTPVDFSQGINMAPPKQGGLPNPGSAIPAPPRAGAPGGFVPQQTLEDIRNLEQHAQKIQEQGGLEDDYDTVFNNQPPPQPVPQRPVQGRPNPQAGTPVYNAPKKPVHPVLAQLKIDLGIEVIEPIDVNVGGHIWTMKPLAESDISTAARLADVTSQTQTDHNVRLPTALISVSIIAIDKVPVWEVFGIEIPPEAQPLTNPLFPPERVRKMAVVQLYEWISDNSKVGLSTQLHNLFISKIDPLGQVKAQTEDPNNPRFEFTCSTQGCDHKIIDVAKYEMGTKNILPYFCKFHGSVMSPIGKLNNDGGLDPLE